MGISKSTGKYFFFIIVKHNNLDWEIKSEKEAECLLSARISFQNKATKEIKEFFTQIKLALSQEHLEKNNITAKEFFEKNKDSYFAVMFDQLPNAINGSLDTLTNLVQGFEPGTYIVNVDLRHTVTKKSAGGWREEITIP